MKEKIYKLIEKGSHGNKANLIFDYCIIALILLNVIAMVLESISEIKMSFGKILWAFEVLSVIIFSIEYILRIYISDLSHPSSNRLKSATRFIFSFYGLIDLLAIMPFYLPFLTVIDLRFLRIIRLTRLFRVLKINRYNSSMKLLWDVIMEKRAELSITGFITLLILIISSFVMYYVEGGAQPYKFSDILTSFWWAVATLTTVGYGDIYPVTGIGKLISGIIAILGIGIVALPTGIISAGFINKIEKNDTDPRQCPNCGEKIN